FGPLIKATLKRHQLVEKDHRRTEWQVESKNREDPKDVLIDAKLRCPAYPLSADYKGDLSENEIEQAEFFLQNTAVSLNFALQLDKFFCLTCWRRFGRQDVFRPRSVFEDELPLKPGANVLTHFRHDFVAGCIALELNALRTC